MLFNSLSYLVFIPVVFVVFHLMKQQNHRIIWLVLASYFFYMCSNPVYIVLILGSTILDYLVSKYMMKTEDDKKRFRLLLLSFIGNIGILFYFKYYNFLCDNIELVLSWANLVVELPDNNWLLPVGISFYTFQTFGYTLDVYNEEIEAERNFFTFSLYVSFFPQLVAGPIERAGSLLPQLKEKYILLYDKCADGFRLILIGFFKKIVVADRLAIYVNQVFDNPDAYSGSSVMMAAVFFTLQIYCDFSGYSDIAIGTAKLFGVDLMDNFKGPLLSKSVTEFWRRWHISMSSWFRDYLYTPIAFSMRSMGKYNYVLPILISFTLIGVWHGANWTYIIFGFLHAVVLLYEAFTREFRAGLSKKLPVIMGVGGIVLTFCFYAYTCLIFRAENMSHVGELTQAMFQFEKPGLLKSLTKSSDKFDVYLCFALIIPVLVLHVIEYGSGFLVFFRNMLKPVRWMVYVVLVLMICTLGVFNSYQEFIYFQF